VDPTTGRSASSQGSRFTGRSASSKGADNHISVQRRTKLQNMLKKEYAKDWKRRDEEETQHLVGLRDKLVTALSDVEGQIFSRLDLTGGLSKQGTSRPRSAQSSSARRWEYGTDFTQRSGRHTASRTDRTVLTARSTSSIGLQGSRRTTAMSTASGGQLKQVLQNLRGLTRQRLLECWRDCELKATGGLPQYHSFRQCVLKAGIPLPESSTRQIFRELQQGWEGSMWAPPDLSRNGIDEAMRTITPVMFGDTLPKRSPMQAKEAAVVPSLQPGNAGVSTDLFRGC